MDPTLPTVVILAHNQAALTRACMDALADGARNSEVVLADNGSTDDTPALAREYAVRFRRFAHLRLPSNLAYAVANNRAAMEATGRTLLFLNNDVLVSSEAVATLTTTVERHGGVAGARLVYPGGTHLQHAGMRQMLWGYASNLGTMAPIDEPGLNAEREIFAVTGAMLAIDRELFARVGGFDERYRWGYEDVDLCLKAREAGAAVRYVPTALSVHAESATLKVVRQSADLQHNYGLYRRRWNHRLVPTERAAAERLRGSGVRRVVVFGAGLAAAGLFRTLKGYGIEVDAFTASAPDVVRYLDRPVVPLDALAGRQFDRLLVGSQHYFELRERLAPYDPAGQPIFPVVDD